MRTIITTFLIFLSAIGFGQATWVGGFLGDEKEWTNTMNWSPNAVPGAGINVTIPTALTHYPVLNTSNCAVNNLNIAAGASLTIGPTGQLTVSGTLTNSNGVSGLIFQSDANNSGTMIYSTTGVDATVNVSIAGDEYSVVFVSSPVANAPSSILGPKTSYFYDEPLADGWGAGLTAIDGWEIMSGNMTVGKGYTYDKFQNTLTFAGTLTNCSSNYNFVPTFTNTVVADQYDGYNLLGNPLVSKIDWNKVVLSNVDATYYYFDPIAQNYKVYQQDGLGGGSGTGSRYIKPGHGFFVKVSAAGVANIEIVPDAKALKTGGEIQDFVKLEAKANNFTDESIFRIASDATNNFDSKYDGYKLFATNKAVPQIYSVENNIDLSINTVPVTTDSKIFDLKFKCQKGNNYTLSLNETNLTTFSFVYLVDKITGKTIELKKDETYTFNYEENDANINRFTLRFEKTALSVNENIENNINIYPNPANDIIYVQSNSVKSTYQISNISGKTVLSGKFDNNQKIDVSELSKGVYFISVNTKDNKIVKKIVKN